MDGATHGEVEQSEWKWWTAILSVRDVRRVLLLWGYAGDPFGESGVRLRRDIAQSGAAGGQRGWTGGTSITRQARRRTW
jgi:hypothetical protein